MALCALDLDGVVWLGDRAIVGASAAIACLGAAGHGVLYCTNNSASTIDGYRRKLASFGIAALPEQILTSAVAVAGLVPAGASVLCAAGPGVVEALRERAERVDLAWESTEPRYDAVVIGFHREFGYESLQRIVRAVLDGARLFATNDDPIYPASDGPAPGCGAFLSAVEVATGTTAVVAGKPNAAMVDLVRARAAALSTRSAGGAYAGPDSIMVGDSPRTDGALASALGWPFGLVLTGNTGASDSAAVAAADYVATSLGDLVDQLLAAGSGRA